jgi:micrococcal nuclease
MYTYYGTIVHIVDGDTVDVVLDLGFDVTIEQRVRLLGVNCAERFTEDGRLATSFVENWVDDQQGKVIVATEKNTYDKYGRYVADIFTVDMTQQSLSQQLLAKGLATSYPI